MKINLNNITKIYADEAILEACDLEVKLGDHIAIVGENGSGKSTLLKIIAGLENYQEGQRIVPKDIKVGYMHQQFPRFEGTAHAYVMDQFGELLELERRMQILEQGFATSDDLDLDLEKYERVTHQFEAQGGYQVGNDIQRIATGLAISNVLEQDYNELSGGQKTRIELVKLLVSNVDVLCLDEPTNHLDYDGIQWLENYCKSLRKTLIIVSHDREFLNQVVAVIHDIEDGSIVTYHGNYDSFQIQKKERFARLVLDYEAQQKIIQKLKLAIRRYRQWGHESDNEDFFKRAKAIEKRLEKMEKLPKPEELERKLNLSFDLKNRSGKQVLVAQALDVGYTHPLGNPKNLNILWQERVALLGANGTGKSTLIKTIMGEIPALGGTLKIGESVSIGYLPQQHVFEDDNERILSFTQRSLSLSEFDARRMLAQFGFYQSDVYKPIRYLSGGEKVRIKLMEIMHRKHNLIVLDEPTNHLDIQSCEILEDVLMQYQGTLIVVSHDRYFLRRLNVKNIEI